MEQSITNRVTVSAMVEAYKQADQIVRQAYASLDEAQKLLQGAFGEHYSDFSTLPENRYYGGHKALTDEIMFRVKKNAWKQIIHRLGIRKVMSIKAVEDLDKKLDEGKNMPDIETAAIFDLLNLLVQNSQDYAKQAILEVYELLRPSNRGGQGWGRELKTNQKNGKFALGKKVILAWKVEGSYDRNHPYRVCYRNEEELLAIEKVFCNLDGKGIPEGYKSKLADAINTSPDGFGETEYFKFRACLNRNLHLEFKRLDLVRKINQIAGASPNLRD